mmetsp:Transcript_7896/g.23250  ORF Transcript_7896/g.23250 Transcript_7896/m.23250 type:complete len:200 (+) Transcript_7896:151-750(+)
MSYSRRCARTRRSATMLAMVWRSSHSRALRCFTVTSCSWSVLVYASSHSTVMARSSVATSSSWRSCPAILESMPCTSSVLCTPLELSRRRCSSCSCSATVCARFSAFIARRMRSRWAFSSSVASSRFCTTTEMKRLMKMKWQVKRKTTLKMRLDSWPLSSSLPWMTVHPSAVTHTKREKRARPSVPHRVSSASSPEPKK